MKGLRKWMVSVSVMLTLVPVVHAQDYWTFGIGSGLSTAGVRSMDIFYAKQYDGFIMSLKSNSLPILHWNTDRENFTSFTAGYLRGLGNTFNLFATVGTSIEGESNELGVSGGLGMLYRLNVMSVSCELSTEKALNVSAYFTFFQKQAGTAYRHVKRRMRIRKGRKAYYLSNVTRDIHRVY